MAKSTAPSSLCFLPPLMRDVSCNMKLNNGYTVEEVIAFGNKRKSCFTLEEYKPDIKGKVEIFKNAKDVPVTSGYRPAHEIHGNIGTTGEHIYYENEIVFPGETAMAYIKFLSPESYIHSLYEGKELSIKEASQVVGKVIITEVYNEQLQTAKNV